jgi:uncharacterized protein YqjF (DUF2071 family)
MSPSSHNNVGFETEQASGSILDTVAHRPFERPDRPWTMTQRWNDLVFAHWPIPTATMAALLPTGLEVDTFDGYAWAGVVPFWMDRVRVRIPGTADRTVFFPSVETFPELNLRTYVRSRRTGHGGVFFFSLDAGSPLAVAGARTIFHLPYFLASMTSKTGNDGTVEYRSRRLLTRPGADFEATYRGLGQPADAAPSQPGTIEHFLTERYCLFTTFRGRVLVGNIHHLPWPLEPAEAEIRVNQLPAAHGLTLPARPPILHFSRALEVYIWSLRPDGSV